MNRLTLCAVSLPLSSSRWLFRVNRHAFLAFATMFAIAVLNTPARAGVIYSQVGSFAPIGAFSSNDSGDPTDQKVADNFLFTSPSTTTIRSLRVIGGYGLTSPPPLTPPLNSLPPDDFRVIFFSNTAGAPGIPLAGGDFHAGTAIQRTPTGGPLLNGTYTPFEYFLDLGGGVSVSPNNIYWLSIVNNVGPNYGWVWANTAGAFDQGVAATFGDIATGPWSTTTNGGMYFELNDNNIPEPALMGIIFTGGCGMWWYWMRRRS